uniref:G_PROTEIN_RECEP_F1_2 domain-containing protein n=1 Tax=Panagrellus redivivus TaxID=6233 RepID=A0A7E4ZSH6_PANRE
MTSVCQFIQKLPLGTDLLERHIYENLSNVSNANQDSVSLLNKITYAYIAPVIITIGVIGDILTVATLTHPLLRRGSIVYTYLTLLAMTDLLTHISVIPMIFWLLDWRLCSWTSAIYYAHIGFPLANALMGASVWIVVFLTLSQYMAVCHPFHHGFFRKRRMCFWLFAFAYIFNFCIYAPWSTKKNVHQLPEGLLQCSYLICDRKKESWFLIYEWIREFWTRVFPFLLIAFFNLRILVTYRSTKRDRMRRLTSSQSKRKAGDRSEQEERRLFFLLFAIIIVFFLCTIPAAPLTIFVADSLSKSLTFQIIRAIVNLLEFTKFALNFYFYCLINPDIRRISWHIIQCRKLNKPARVKGQPVNPISIYTRSTKSTVRALHGDSSRRSSRYDDLPYHQRTHSFGGRSRSASVLTNIIANEAPAYDQLTVIKEADTNSNNLASPTNSSHGSPARSSSSSRLGDDLRANVALV